MIILAKKSESEMLSQMGYETKLRRSLDVFMGFAIGFTEVSVFSSITAMLAFGFVTGGPVMIAFGWVVSSIMTIIVSICLAEICSAFPAAGSVYLWTRQLAPDEWSPFASYYTGILNWLGNVGGDAALAYFFASFVNMTLIIGRYEALSQPGLVLISMIILFVWTVLSCCRIEQIAWLNNLGAITQILSIVIAVIVLLTWNDSLTHFDGDIFFKFINETGFKNNGYVCCIGLLFPLYAFSGYEAASHVAEESIECKTAPLGMIYTCIFGALGGMVYIVALLASVKDVNEVLEGESGNAAVEIFLQVLGPKYAFIMSILVVINTFYGGLSSVLVSTRITYAFVRDGMVPYHEFLSSVDEHYHVPINAALVVFAFDVVLLLLPLTDVGSIAFVSLTGISTVGFQLSYAVPIFFKLWCIDDPTFPRTEFNLGCWSKVLGWISFVWLSFTSISFLLPTSYPVTSENRNYSFLILLIVSVWAVVNWYCVSKHSFKGIRKMYFSAANLQVEVKEDSIDSSQNGKAAEVTTNSMVTERSPLFIIS